MFSGILFLTELQKSPDNFAAFRWLNSLKQQIADADYSPQPHHSLQKKRLCDSSLESKLYKNTFPQVDNESKSALIEYLADLNKNFDESVRKILKT